MSTQLPPVALVGTLCGVATGKLVDCAIDSILSATGSINVLAFTVSETSATVSGAILTVELIDLLLDSLGFDRQSLRPSLR